jgi:hypothetical protein
MKNKETLEEAAEKEYGESKSDLVSDLDRIMYKCYMAGADFGVKWRQERSYSEEDMIEYADYSWKFSNDNRYKNPLSPKDWFNKFKKK